MSTTSLQTPMSLFTRISVPVDLIEDLRLHVHLSQSVSDHQANFGVDSTRTYQNYCCKSVAIEIHSNAEQFSNHTLFEKSPRLRGSNQLRFAWHEYNESYLKPCDSKSRKLYPSDCFLSNRVCLLAYATNNETTGSKCASITSTGFLRFIRKLNHVSQNSVQHIDI